MIKLRKFYDLLHKNVHVTLFDPDWMISVYYEGPLKGIPDAYDDWTVVDFHMSDSGDIFFEIREEVKA